MIRHNPHMSQKAFRHGAFLRHPWNPRWLAIIPCGNLLISLAIAFRGRHDNPGRNQPYGSTLHKISDTPRVPIAMTPGQPACYDYEYERNGKQPISL